MAMNRVLRTMQIVMARSTKGSITIKFTICLTFSQGVQQSQIKQVLANLYQHGGHFCLDSSSSREKKVNNILNIFLYLNILPVLLIRPMYFLLKPRLMSSQKKKKKIKNNLFHYILDLI